MAISDLLSIRQIQAIRHSKATWNLWYGSIRSGKTWASYYWWLSFVLRHAPKHGDLLMVAKTERTLWRNVIAPMKELFGERAVAFRKGDGEGSFFGRRFYAASANDESSQDKIRGMTLAGCYGDEATLWPESFFQMLRGRLSVYGAQALLTTNPDGPYHYIKRELVDRVGESALSIHLESFLLQDNPFVSDEYRRRIEAEYTGLWYRRYILGEWCQAEGSVYDGWDPAEHVKPTPDSKPDLTYIGIDYGTTNPTVFLRVEVRGDNVHVVDEYYFDSRETGRQKTGSEYVQDLEKFIGHGSYPLAIVVDPSAASFQEEMRRRGITPTDADNSVLDGIRDVAALLSQGRLTVSPSCQSLIREFASYVWDSKAQSRGEDKPIKEHDHALDALRYVVRTKVTSGNNVMTWLRAFGTK